MTKPRGILILASAVIVACVAAIFVPSLWWIGYMGGGVESVWSISKLAALISLGVSVAIACLPLFSSAAWRWRVPGSFGALLIAACIAMAIQSFFAYRHDGSGGFHPIGIVVAAVAGALLLAEGLVARSHRV